MLLFCAPGASRETTFLFLYLSVLESYEVLYRPRTLHAAARYTYARDVLVVVKRGLVTSTLSWRDEGLAMAALVNAVACTRSAYKSWGAYCCSFVCV